MRAWGSADHTDPRERTKKTNMYGLQVQRGGAGLTGIACPFRPVRSCLTISFLLPTAVARRKLGPQPPDATYTNLQEPTRPRLLTCIAGFRASSRGRCSPRRSAPAPPGLHNCSTTTTPTLHRPITPGTGRCTWCRAYHRTHTGSHHSCLDQKRRPWPRRFRRLLAGGSSSASSSASPGGPGWGPGGAAGSGAAAPTAGASASSISTSAPASGRGKRLGRAPG